MPIQTINTKQMGGFTLVEMLISSAISLVLISGVLGIAIGVMGSSAENLKRTHLVQELRGTMSLMVRDIRRAGFNGSGIDLVFQNGGNAFTQDPYMLTVPGGIGSCITYAYDEVATVQNPNNPDGAVDIGARIDERQGFRLNGSKVDTFKGLNNGDVLSCKGNGWERVTSSFVTITQLQFDATNEQCYNTSVTPNVLVPACDITTLNTKEVMTKLVSVDIVLRGQLTSDNTVVREVRDSVKIRNVQSTIAP